MKFSMRLVLTAFCFTTLFARAADDATIKTDKPLPPRPAVLYVTNFELDAKASDEDQGILPHGRSRNGPLGRLRNRLNEGEKDPAEKSQELVELMAKTLVAKLKDAGFNAERLDEWELKPDSGVVVRGVFTQVDEGGRMRRAMIGFGAGGTDLQLVTSLYDLSKGDPKPLYQFDEKTESRKKPGAIIMLNPYVAAAKFVMSGKDLEKNVKRAAGDVAKDIAKRYQPAS
jgi:hypothetical protein